MLHHINTLMHRWRAFERWRAHVSVLYGWIYRYCIIYRPLNARVCKITVRSEENETGPRRSAVARCQRASRAGSSCLTDFDLPQSPPVRSVSRTDQSTRAVTAQRSLRRSRSRHDRGRERARARHCRPHRFTVERSIDRSIAFSRGENFILKTSTYISKLI